MALSLGLSYAEHREYLTTLASSHHIKVTVQILDNQHSVVSTVSHILMDGQVDANTVSASGDSIEVSRTCSLVFLDPKRTMTFDSASPASGALYLDRMIRVIYSVRCPSRWVDVPVFTGPVYKCDRDGDLVNVEAHGKEAYGLRESWDTATYDGTVVAAIRGLLTSYGETSRRWDLPSSVRRLVKPIVVARDSHAWLKAFVASAALDRVLYYDGRGIARCVPRPPKTSMVIRSGDGGMLLSDPQISFDTSALKNRVLVRGGIAIGSTANIRATATAPTTHPLSPWKIGLGTKPGYLVLIDENPDIRTVAVALARAKSLLAKFLLQQIDVAATCLPVPHMEPWDIVTMTTPHFTMDVRVNAFSLPLRQAGSSGTPMTFGYQKKLTAPRRAVRRA